MKTEIRDKTDPIFLANFSEKGIVNRAPQSEMKKIQPIISSPVEYCFAAARAGVEMQHREREAAARRIVRSIFDMIRTCDVFMVE